MNTSQQESADKVIDYRQTNERELRDAVNAMPTPDPDSDELPPLIELRNIDGLDAACMRWRANIRVRATGDWGDYAWAHNGGPDVTLHGNVGDGFGEGMHGGVLHVTGDAGCGCGTSMTGGTLAVLGSAGDRCGAAMRGGGLFVRGHVGDDAGMGALAGTLVIGGDAGHRLGEGFTVGDLGRLTIFIRGQAASLAQNVIETKLRPKETVRLGLLLMSASIRGEASDFRRIVSTERFRQEEKGLGDIRPSWR
ncbi:MAG: tributyrin esterase [Planctomycetota bacterium]